jgi:hypothetical protein
MIRGLRFKIYVKLGIKLAKLKTQNLKNTGIMEYFP